MISKWQINNFRFWSAQVTKFKETAIAPLTIFYKIGNHCFQNPKSKTAPIRFLFSEPKVVPVFGTQGGSCFWNQMSTFCRQTTRGPGRRVGKKLGKTNGRPRGDLIFLLLKSVT